MPPRDKTLHISFRTDPATIDPRKSGDLVTSTLLFMMYSGLMQQKNGQIYPSLAKGYEISKDQKTYTFYLRDDAIWSDGHPITAHDFVYSWKKVLDPNFPALCPQLFYCIQGAEEAAQGSLSLDEVAIKAIEDKVLQVTLVSPTPYFLSLTSFCIFFPIPEHLEKKDPQWEKNTINRPITSGPFSLVTWEPNNYLQLKKNPNHSNAKEIDIDAVMIRIIDNELTALQMFEKKEIDFIGTPISPMPIDALEALKDNPNFQTSPVGGTLFCAFNTQHPLLQNAHLRRALSYCIDKREITTNITQLDEEIGSRVIPPILMGNTNKELIPYNIQLANEELVKAREELGESLDNLTLVYGTSYVHKKIAETLQHTWKKHLGVHVNIQSLENKILREKLFKHTFCMALSCLIVQYNDPMNVFERFLFAHLNKNYPAWENPQFIEKISQLRNATNPLKRQKYVLQAEGIMAEELPFCPLYHFNYKLLTQENVEGISVGPIGEITFEQARILPMGEK